MRSNIDSAIHTLSSLISDVVPARFKHKGKAAEVHIDVSEALGLIIKTMREEARAAARAEVRLVFKELLEK